MSHSTCTQGNRNNSLFLMVRNQIFYLTPGLFFGHNLYFKCPNGSCEPILDIYVPRVVQWYKELFNTMGFDLCNRFLKIRDSIETPTPKVGAPLGVWRFIPSHSLALLGTWDVTLELPSWPSPLQAFALVVSTRLRLWHLFCLKLKLIQVPIGIWYCSSCSPTIPWFLLRPCHIFPDSNLKGIHENFISTSSCALYIYMCVHIFLVD